MRPWAEASCGVDVLKTARADGQAGHDHHRQHDDGRHPPHPAIRVGANERGQGEEPASRLRELKRVPDRAKRGEPDDSKHHA